MPIERFCVALNPNEDGEGESRQVRGIGQRVTIFVDGRGIKDAILIRAFEKERSRRSFLKEG
jgi:hypothetical protein